MFGQNLTERADFKTCFKKKLFLKLLDTFFYLRCLVFQGAIAVTSSFKDFLVSFTTTAPVIHPSIIREQLQVYLLSDRLQ